MLAALILLDTRTSGGFGLYVHLPAGSKIQDGVYRDGLGQSFLRVPHATARGKQLKDELHSL